jgi:hypothetical protein
MREVQITDCPFAPWRLCVPIFGLYQIVFHAKPPRRKAPQNDTLPLRRCLPIVFVPVFFQATPAYARSENNRLSLCAVARLRAHFWFVPNCISRKAATAQSTPKRYASVAASRLCVPISVSCHWVFHAKPPLRKVYQNHTLASRLSAPISLARQFLFPANWFSRQTALPTLKSNFFAG